MRRRNGCRLASWRCAAPIDEARHCRGRCATRRRRTHADCACRPCEQHATGLRTLGTSNHGGGRNLVSLEMIRANIIALAIAMIAIVWYPAQSAPMSSESELSPPSAESADNGFADPETAPTYSDEELRSFAAAVVEVHRINDEYIP